ncbi:MAG: hypothetical protein AB7I38_16095 [Dehalococcoidia bacterium]
MSRDSGGSAFAGGILAIGLFYWFGVFVAFAVLAGTVGAIAAGVGLVIYLGLAGRAYIHALRSRNAARIRDALLAPIVGVVLGFLAGDDAESGIRQLLRAFEDVQNNGTWLAGLVAGLVFISVLFGLLWVGFIFPFYVTSESDGRRIVGYVICAGYGIAYSGVVILIIKYLTCIEVFPDDNCI